MKINNHISAFLILLSAMSCRNSAELKDDRIVYTPYENVVEVITLEKKDFNRQLLSNGTVKASNHADLMFTTGGMLKSVHAASGDFVSKGTIIAEVDRPDLHLSLKEAENNMAKAEYDLLDFLAGQGHYGGDTVNVSKDLMAMAKMRSGYNAASIALQRIRNEVSGARLTAPFSGRVAGVNLKVYDHADASKPFCTLVDDSVMDVDFTVMESEYSFLQKGLPVKVSPYADRTKVYEGKIKEINPMVDGNGQISVRASIKNDGSLLDGMNVSVVAERSIPQQLVVPKSAVVIRDNLDVLFTYTDDGKAHWVYVNILQSNKDSHIVAANKDRGANLNEGDRVIVSGNLNLADESEVVLKK